MTDIDLFDLDKHRLDEEWTEQPRHYNKAAVALADKRADYERAMADRDVTEAELDRDIRIKFEKEGTKVTEAVVKNAVTRHRDMIDAVQAVIRARHEMDVAQALVVALDHRKKSLESLVQLWLANYFASPRAKTEEVHSKITKPQTTKAFDRRRRD